MASRKTRVLQVDDSPEERRLLELLIRMESDLEVVASMADTAGLREEVLRSRPDVLVFDLGLVATDPLEAIRDVRNALPDVGILVYSGYSNPDAIADATAAGATEYVVKTSEIGRLLAAIRRVAARQRPG